MRVVEVKQRDVGIKVDNEENIADLKYANDTALLALMLTSLASILQQLAEESGKFVMKINFPKTKWMKVCKSEGNTTEQLFFQGEMIERVDDFKYLGSQISSNGNQKIDVEVRLQKATTAFKRLYRGIWKRRYMTLKTKFRVYRALV